MAGELYGTVFRTVSSAQGSDKNRENNPMQSKGTRLAARLPGSLPRNLAITKP
jgi:hypothetical protein